MTPTHHVMLSLSLSLVILIVAGDSWTDRVRRFQPVQAVARKV